MQSSALAADHGRTRGPSCRRND